MNVPASTIIWHKRSFSSWLPSAQTTLLGLHSAAISPTQSRSLPLVVGLFTVAPISLPSSSFLFTFAARIDGRQCTRHIDPFLGSSQCRRKWLEHKSPSF